MNCYLDMLIFGFKYMNTIKNDICKHGTMFQKNCFIKFLLNITCDFVSHKIFQEYLDPFT